jgi:hypothetical protein
VTGRSEIKERGAGPTPSFRAALAEAADLIQELLDTAESAAGRIVADAEDRARRIRQEADPEPRPRVPESADSADEEESLPTTLARPPVAGPTDSGASTSTPRDAERDDHPPDPPAAAGHGRREAPASRERAPAPVSSPPGDLADAQLLAVQMALAGRSDDEIERRLRQQFRGEEVELALDVVGKLGADRR